MASADLLLHTGTHTSNFSIMMRSGVTGFYKKMYTVVIAFFSTMSDSKHSMESWMEAGYIFCYFQWVCPYEVNRR